MRTSPEFGIQGELQPRQRPKIWPRFARKRVEQCDVVDASLPGHCSCAEVAHGGSQTQSETPRGFSDCVVRGPLGPGLRGKLTRSLSGAIAHDTRLGCAIARTGVHLSAKTLKMLRADQTLVASRPGALAGPGRDGSRSHPPLQRKWRLSRVVRPQLTALVLTSLHIEQTGFPHPWHRRPGGQHSLRGRWKEGEWACDG